MMNKTVKSISPDTSVTPSLAASLARTVQGPACKHNFAHVMKHCKTQPHRSAGSERFQKGKQKK